MEREKRRKERREEKRKEQEKNSANTKRNSSEMERQGTGDLKGKKKNVGSGGRQAKLSSPSKKSVVWGTCSNRVLCVIVFVPGSVSVSVSVCPSVSVSVSVSDSHICLIIYVYAV